MKTIIALLLTLMLLQNCETIEKIDEISDKLSESKSFEATNSIEGTVYDYDGNEYTVIRINEQVWLAENLRTTHYNNGDELTSLVNIHTGQDSIYGRYYDYYTISDERGVCPVGFRIPTMIDFDILEFWSGKDLASKSGWDVSTIPGFIAYNQSLNNITGFNAIPAGNVSVQSFGLSYDGWKRQASFWTINKANDRLDYRAMMKRLYYEHNWFETWDYPKDWYFSVRCIKI